VGVFAPAGTPAALLERYNREINEIAASPELAVILNPDGSVPATLTPGDFSKRVKDELQMWKQVAAQHKIEAQ
jgi:tripartite-type tricarboxylate transporter receptor subunit TctC